MLHLARWRISVPRKSLFICLLLCLGLLMVLPCHAKRKPKAFKMKEWVDGPIRYVITKPEVKKFKALTTDNDRALFIEKFWVRRDPMPDTLTNSYRQLFWKRVQEANSNFMDSSTLGWRTDRGKIHILYGPPTEIKEDIHLATYGVSEGGHGVIRWIYEGRPSGRGDLDTITVVPFVRDGTGEYRLSYDPTLASVFFDPLIYRDRGQGFSSKFWTGRNALGRSELSVMLDLGKMQEVPPEEQLLLERVETSESYVTKELDVQVDRYWHPEQQQTLVAVTAQLAGMPVGSRPPVIARFTRIDTPDVVHMLGEDSFLIAESGASRLAQARLTLPAGVYALTVMMVNPDDLSTGLHRTNVTIPAATERFRFSDMVLALELDPLKYAELVSYDEPFLLGAFKVLPKLDSIYRRGEPLRIFYQVYDAEAPFTVSYQLEGQEQDGRWVALGSPSVSEQQLPSQGWELPTGENWPLGEYRVHIEVQDSAGRLIATQVPFSLE
jgi:GWxTD domain-containing protein